MNKNVLNVGSDYSRPSDELRSQTDVLTSEPALSRSSRGGGGVEVGLGSLHQVCADIPV